MRTAVRRRESPAMVWLERSTSLFGGLLASSRESAAPPATIGLVCMTKKPCCLETWLRYHRDVCGVLRFYLRVEDTPELAELLGRAPWDACV